MHAHNVLAHDMWKCEQSLQENVTFPTQKVVAHDTCGKLCGFIHYNVQYVMFIVTYITTWD
jgi:hypothetical protein